MSAIGCPICGKDDMVQKVSAIVQGETFEASGQSSTIGSANTAGLQQLYDSQGRYTGHGELAGVTNSHSVTNTNTTQRSVLANQLAQPAVPRKPQAPEVIKLSWIDSRRLSRGFLGRFVIGILSAIPISVLLYFVLLDVLISLFGALAIAVLIPFLPLPFLEFLTQEKRLKRELEQHNLRLATEYNRALDEYDHAREHYDDALANWKKAYYCRRDDVVYIPTANGQSRAVEPSRVAEIL